MPSPGDVVPYPPYPAAGAAAQGSLQYSLETTQLLVKDVLAGVLARLPPALAADQSLRVTLQNSIEAAITGTVAVSNMIPAVETGLAKETTLNSVGAAIVAAEGARDTDATALQARADLLASEATLAGRFAQVIPKTGDFTDVGPHDLAVPSVGANALKVVWLYAQAVAALGNSAVEVTFKLGAATLYKFELTGSQPWAHAAVLPPGAAGEKLTLTMNVAGVRVLANADVKEFTP